MSGRVAKGDRQRTRAPAGHQAGTAVAKLLLIVKTAPPGEEQDARLPDRLANGDLMSATNPTDRAAGAARNAPALAPALDADRREITGASGRLSYYVAGRGAPLLLLHSINAAPSAYEVRPIFEAKRATRRVFAPDLPGFGFSDRSRRDYSVRLYVAAVFDMLDVIAQEAGDTPVDVVALSLASEFSAHAATQKPARFRTLTMVGPTGLANPAPSVDAPPDETREMPTFRRVLEFPLWRQALYNGLVSRPSIRYFLARTWGSKNIDEGMFEYAWLTSHQPGACNAPYAFLAGKLFTKNILAVYEALRMPVWVTHGVRGDFQDLKQLPQLLQRPNVTARQFDSGAMPHFERRAEFMEGLARFLAGGTPAR